MSSDRNRSEGWKHAKLTGHENEELVTEDITYYVPTLEISISFLTTTLSVNVLSTESIAI